MNKAPLSPSFQLERLGVVLAPNGDASECEGILNPGAALDRQGRLVLYPRMVAEGNISRVGMVEVGGSAQAPTYTRRGFALEPQAPYELRDEPGGFGCEDPRVTFIPVLDCYVMIYAAYGPAGPRLAIAISQDGYEWQRLGLCRFAADLADGADKDAAFFAEPVLSPAGVESLALYHRPMSWTAPPITPAQAREKVLSLPPNQREGIRIAYVPLAAVQRDISALLQIAESVLVVAPDPQWGRIKIGAGTAPLQIADGWFSLYHGVDVGNDETRSTSYSVAAVIHDLRRPHEVRYRSSEPLWIPQTADELFGTVDNVVFPTGIVALPGQPNAFDVYYGMADTRIGRLRLTIVP